jgi:hypothetical protein
MSNRRRWLPAEHGKTSANQCSRACAREMMSAMSTPAKPASKTRPRTPRQLERQFRAYQLAVVEEKTVRELAEILGVAQCTVVSDIRHEAERRAEKIRADQDVEVAKSVSFYEGIIRMALQKGKIYDAMIARALKDQTARLQAKVNDRTLDTALKARERIDKVLGIESPIKIDTGLSTLLDALKPRA